MLGEFVAATGTNVSVTLDMSTNVMPMTLVRNFRKLVSAGPRLGAGHEEGALASDDEDVSTGACVVSADSMARRSSGIVVTTVNWTVVTPFEDAAVLRVTADEGTPKNAAKAPEKAGVIEDADTPPNVSWPVHT